MNEGNQSRFTVKDKFNLTSCYSCWHKRTLIPTLYNMMPTISSNKGRIFLLVIVVAILWVDTIEQNIAFKAAEQLRQDKWPSNGQQPKPLGA